jgi:hypothetical protein
MSRKNQFLFSLIIAGFFLFIRQGRCDTINTCVQYQSVTVGSYIIDTDYWNEDKCPGTQCMNIDDKTGAFSVTESTADCTGTVSGYPSALYGCAFGSCSPNSDLPAPISSLQCVYSDWDFTPTNTGSWDAAYDIWVCPDNNCGTSGFNGGAEVMIWLDYHNAHAWQYDMGAVTLSGMKWEVWQWDTGWGSNKWKYVAYLCQTPVTSIKNLDIKGFLNDCQTRGYVKNSWYLSAVEVGNELSSGGIPFTSNHFSVSVNKNCGAKPIFTPGPTFTPTALPDAHAMDEPPPPP